MSSSPAPQSPPEAPAKRLRAMADEMADIAAELDYFGGLSKKSKAGPRPGRHLHPHPSSCRRH